MVRIFLAVALERHLGNLADLGDDMPHAVRSGRLNRVIQRRNSSTLEDVACRPHIRLNRDGVSGFAQTRQRHLFSLSAIEAV